MRILSLSAGIVLVLLLAISPATGQDGSQTIGWIVVGSSDRANYASLEDAITDAPDGSMIMIEPGSYAAVPEEFSDPQCGNCQDPATVSQASTGFAIRGKSLIIMGSGAESTELVTNAGYGVYIEDCPDVQLFDLSITGGVRDQDGAATDAGLVVRRSSVEIARCEIHDNQGDFSVTIAGVGGIMGREGAIIKAHDNRIHDNSWDGIALYRDATATIYDNEIWNGRGAGIGITWDAQATVMRNNIHDYWKGIGSFGNSRVVALNNFVHDLAGWGIIACGTSDMICRNNTVVRCGNVGIAGWEETARIEIVNNVIAFNGVQEQWVAPRVGIWMNCLPGNYVIAYNDLYDNHDANVAFGYREFEDGTWSFEEARDFIGTDGNISSDPLLAGDGYGLMEGSKCVDSGDPACLDPDSSVSDIGATGGPFSRPEQ
jgi:hypothetical protein